MAKSFLLRKWPDRLSHRNGTKVISITFRGLIQLLHFSCKEKAPTPSELRHHGVWPSWFHARARDCKYNPSNHDFVMVSLIYSINALRIKYGVTIPYNWDILSEHTDALINLVYSRLGLRCSAPGRRNPALVGVPTPPRSSRSHARVRSHKRMQKFCEKAKRRAGFWDSGTSSLYKEEAESRKYVPPHRRVQFSEDVCPSCQGKMVRKLKPGHPVFVPNPHPVGTYMSAWTDCESGLMTRDQFVLKHKHFGTDHQADRSQFRWETEHPFTCVPCSPRTFAGFSDNFVVRRIR